MATKTTVDERSEGGPSGPAPATSIYELIHEHAKAKARRKELRQSAEKVTTQRTQVGRQPKK